MTIIVHSAEGEGATVPRTEQAQTGDTPTLRAGCRPACPCGRGACRRPELWKTPPGATLHKDRGHQVTAGFPPTQFQGCEAAGLPEPRGRGSRRPRTVTLTLRPRRSHAPGAHTPACSRNLATPRPPPPAGPELAPPAGGLSTLMGRPPAETSSGLAQGSGWTQLGSRWAEGLQGGPDTPRGAWGPGLCASGCRSPWAQSTAQVGTWCLGPQGWQGLGVAPGGRGQCLLLRDSEPSPAANIQGPRHAPDTGQLLPTPAAHKDWVA